MIYSDLQSFAYKYYLNGDLVIYPKFDKQPSNILLDSDRKKKRNFRLTYQKYRLLSCAAILLLKQAKNRVVFLTLTFPKPISDENANKVLNRFLKNFTKNYGCNNYLGVLEHTELGNPHYHFLFDFPYKKISIINDAFSHAFTGVTGDNGSSNMVRLPKDSPSCVDDHAGMVRYLCKYFSKSRAGTYTARCYFISRGVRQQAEPRGVTAEQALYLFENIEPKKKYQFEFSGVHCYNHEEANEILGTTFDNSQVLTNKIKPDERRKKKSPRTV